MYEDSMFEKAAAFVFFAIGSSIFVLIVAGLFDVAFAFKSCRSIQYRIECLMHKNDKTALEVEELRILMGNPELNVKVRR